MPSDPIRLALLAVPLFALGFGAGALRALGRREGLPPRRRRYFQAAWVLLLLVGGPTWLVLAAVLQLW
jgi:hypothetical protein